MNLMTGLYVYNFWQEKMHIRSLPKEIKTEIKKHHLIKDINEQLFTAEPDTSLVWNKLDIQNIRTLAAFILQDNVGITAYLHDFKSPLAILKEAREVKLNLNLEERGNIRRFQIKGDKLIYNGDINNYLPYALLYTVYDGLYLKEETMKNLGNVMAYNKLHVILSETVKKPFSQILIDHKYDWKKLEQYSNEYILSDYERTYWASNDFPVCLVIPNGSFNDIRERNVTFGEAIPSLTFNKSKASIAYVDGKRLPDYILGCTTYQDSDPNNVFDTISKGK